MSYKDDTIKIANIRSTEIANAFVAEVKRLLRSGVDPKDHNRGLLFGIALENVAENYLRGDKQSKAYQITKRI